MRIEQVIFNNLLCHDDYARKTLPFLKEEYFQNVQDKVMFNLIEGYMQLYNAIPTKESLSIDLENVPNLNEDAYKGTKSIIDKIEETEGKDLDWLIDRTEKFCQDKAIHNALLDSIKILDEENVEISKGGIPKLLQDALAVTFDSSIGHDFIEDAESRFEFYHTKETRIPFDLQKLNTITNGGLPRKTLNVLMAGTGVGKSLAMCHFAAGNLLDGKNVLYITLEMAEEKIAERIDANLMGVTMDELKNLPKNTYHSKMNLIKSRGVGKLVIKEYPTAAAGVNHFRHLASELRIKKNFIPDIIYIDYLNICASSRLKGQAALNSYLYVKAIAEEQRGLAIELNVPIVTATQVNREGYGSSDFGLEQTSECIQVDELVTSIDGHTIPFGEIQIRDQIESQDGYKTVMMTHHKEEKECIKIQLASGKSIIVSHDHVFPCKSPAGIIDRLSYSQGLVNGHYLSTR